MYLTLNYTGEPLHNAHLGDRGKWHFRGVVIMGSQGCYMTSFLFVVQTIILTGHALTENTDHVYMHIYMYSV